MTTEQALQIQKNFVKGYENSGLANDPTYIQQYECYKVSVEALERQIPKKMDKFNCPVCMHYFEDYSDKNYCPNCGQRLEE